MLQRQSTYLPNDSHNLLALHQVAYDFRQEVNYREAFEEHCQWYYAQAQKHQAELASMEKDISLFAWFSRPRQ
ncbi:MAG: hypothetical protein AAF821_22495 [Cyanobacteria bacterium P01_D01_bin.156]